MSTVLRYDVASGGMGRQRRTPQGGLIVDARMTRTGVFKYVMPDGRTVRELRHPDDVFEQASLDSLAHAPLTDDHPDRVTPENYRDLTMGHVAGDPHKESEGGIDYVAGELRVQDADGVRGVETGDHTELSCGYECRVVQNEGVYNGERHDYQQKEIRYNHVAMGPKGWGRAGPQVRLRLDSGFAVSGSEEGESEPPYVPGMTPEEQRAFDEAKRSAKDAQDALTKERADSAKKIEESAAEAARLKAQNERLTKDSTQTTEQARIDAAVERRSEVIRTADSFLNKDGKWTPTGKTNVAIQREVLAHLEPDLKLDGYSDETVGALFVKSVADAKEERADTALAGVQQALPRLDKKPKGGAGEGDDDDETGPAAKSYDAMCARMKDRWKGDRKSSDGSK